MGASISQRPSKCLKNARRPRRSKSEECLGSKHSVTMGRLFAPWHNLVNVADSRLRLNANAAAKMLELAATDKAVSYEMEKSFNEIHRSNSLDKTCSFHDDYIVDDKAFIDDDYSGDDRDGTNADIHQLFNFNQRKLVIDVNKDSIFEVNLRKGSCGLGFSVLEYDGFIFIKQLFPLEAASQSGLLQEGDIILSANGNALTHLSTFEALQILRKLDNAVTLIVCRLQQFSTKKPVSSSQMFSNFTPMTYDCCVQHREFEIKMKKINGSLGFTLRKDEDGLRSHIVRALVKKPAICDGRIKPGDQIISVNNREIGEMSHQEAVKFLRDCGDEVSLRLRRETLSSSLTSLSSSHFEDNNKTLRKEAVDMLNTLAVKKLKVESENTRNTSNIDENDAISKMQSEEQSNHVYDDDDVYDDDNDDEAGLFEGAFSTLVSQKTSSISKRMQNDYLPNENLAEIADEPVSLPALDIHGDKISFQHSDPAYHSINVPGLSAKNSDDTFAQSELSSIPTSDNKGLLKWKGVVLDSQTESVSNLQRMDATSETIVVQLQRNWNSRLGFSLSYENNTSVISAIHANSVAASDGRLRVGDQILEINSKNVQNLETNEVIKLLRTVRGAVTIKVSRNHLKQI
ncbi:uncharacterized protein LOC135840945 [Planococcus citri]|uniref:uncharacterized protein LOC135840945 n=1 Tax=Planococcus citri TaxID=170843 RepID=UPI0031F917FE